MKFSVERLQEADRKLSTSPFSPLSNQAPVNAPQPRQIWIVNPFDQLPNETDVPLRYWALCRTLAKQGHRVTWWSSDFSHLKKQQREKCPDTDGFHVRLIPTPPYTRNIGLARLKNHRIFAKRFYEMVVSELRFGKLLPPYRIVISLPPLGIAGQAFKIRDFVNQRADQAQSKHQRSATNHHCQVVVDIMDAWPETFYQVIPKPLRKVLGPILLAPMHRSAQWAYQGANKISAVGQSYLNLAKQYLDKGPEVGFELGGKIGCTADRTGQAIESSSSLQSSTTNHQSAKTSKPMFLCYHGTDLERFVQRTEGKPLHSATSYSALKLRNKPLRAVYLGSMGQGYDLITIIKVAAHWKDQGQFPFQIHFAGTGTQFKKLQAESRRLDLLSVQSKSTRQGTQRTGPSLELHSISRIIFHGQLNKDAVNELLLSSDVALVPNKPDSLVACPYKAGEYAAAGLPIISCLEGELNQLLSKWDAGSTYQEGNVDSLRSAFEKYSSNPNLLQKQTRNAHILAGKLFDRETTYTKLAEFILA